jgi:replicative DNA helicase
MRDLKESGELEQSATQVLILNGEETLQSEQHIILEVAKNRDGRTGKTKLIYNRANQRFKEEF